MRRRVGSGRGRTGLRRCADPAPRSRPHARSPRRLRRRRQRAPAHESHGRRESRRGRQLVQRKRAWSRRDRREPERLLWHRAHLRRRRQCEAQGHDRRQRGATRADCTWQVLGTASRKSAERAWSSRTPRENLWWCCGRMRTAATSSCATTPARSGADLWASATGGILEMNDPSGNQAARIDAAGGPGKMTIFGGGAAKTTIGVSAENAGLLASRAPAGIQCCCMASAP